MSATVKTFSSKSNARRGAAAAYKAAGKGITPEQIEALLALHSVDDKMLWGFELPGEEAAAAAAEPEAAPAVPRSNVVNAFQAAAKRKEAPVVQETEEKAPPAELETQTVEDAPAGPNPFGGMVGQLGMVGTQPAPTRNAAPVSDRGGYKVEKDRPKQNGVTRPSKDGLCRQVWDKCDELREANGGVPPSAKDLRSIAADLNWNLNNTLIEFYQWRRFNGISGRTAATPAPAPAAE